MTASDNVRQADDNVRRLFYLITFGIALLGIGYGLVNGFTRGLDWRLP